MGNVSWFRANGCINCSRMYSKTLSSKRQNVNFDSKLVLATFRIYFRTGFSDGLSRTPQSSRSSRPVQHILDPLKALSKTLSNDLTVMNLTYNWHSWCLPEDDFYSNTLLQGLNGPDANETEFSTIYFDQNQSVKP